MTTYWIEWPYWSWKSSYATHKAVWTTLANNTKLKKEELKKLVEDTKKIELEQQKMISEQIAWNISNVDNTWIINFAEFKQSEIIKKTSWKGRTIIFSNIQFNNLKVTNYVRFEDHEFLRVLRTINFINDIERTQYYKYSAFSTLKQRQRNKFTKFKIFYDESTSIQWWRKTTNSIKNDEFNKQELYINQQRKLFTDIYIIGADGNQNDKSLRRHVEWWYRIKPVPTLLGMLPLIRDIWLVEKHKKDEEWNIAMYSYTAKDEKGDYVVKKKPICKLDWFFYKPWVYQYYDDLYKNIDDENKYKDIDLNAVELILAWTPLEETFRSLLKVKN